MARDRRKKPRKHGREDSGAAAGGGGGTGGGSSGSSFGKFLKKRAPIYLGILALFLVFVIPELTKAGLDDILPELEDADERRALDTLMAYSGPDRTGFTMKEAISGKIAEEFGDSIYGHKNTTASVMVVVAPQSPQAEAAGGGAEGTYEVILEVDTHKGSLSYEWTVDPGSGAVDSDDPPSEYLVDYVNFYD